MAVHPARRTALKIEQLSMLATVVVAFAALAALVLTGQASIRQDLRAMQTDTLAGQAALRNEMLTGQAALREEMRAGQAVLREEMRAGQAALREEMLTGQAALREEMLTGQAALREEMLTGQAALREEMREGQFELRAGQARIREYLAALGLRLAVVEHRTDALETRLAVVERRTAERPVVTDAPATGSDPSASPAGSPPRTIPSH